MADGSRRFGRIGGVCVTTVRVGGAWPISVHFGGWRLVMRWIHITYRISDDAAAVTLYWSGTFRSGTFRGHEEGGNKRVWTDPGRLLVVSYFLGVPSDVLSLVLGVCLTAQTSLAVLTLALPTTGLFFSKMGGGKNNWGELFIEYMRPAPESPISKRSTWFAPLTLFSGPRVTNWCRHTRFSHPVRGLSVFRLLEEGIQNQFCVLMLIVRR